MLLLKVIGKNAAAFLKITKGRSYIYVYYFADWGSYFKKKLKKKQKWRRWGGGG